MLESKDKDSVDRVSSFLGAIEDAYSGIENVNVTRTYSLYVDMVK